MRIEKVVRMRMRRGKCDATVRLKVHKREIFLAPILIINFFMVSYA